MDIKPLRVVPPSHDKMVRLHPEVAYLIKPLPISDLDDLELLDHESDYTGNI